MTAKEFNGINEIKIYCVSSGTTFSQGEETLRDAYCKANGVTFTEGYQDFDMGCPIPESDEE